MSSRPVLSAAVGLLTVVGVGWLVLHRASATPTANPTGAVTAARVVRATVAEHTVAGGTLGYPGPVTVMAAVPGMVTWLPRGGATVGVDQRLYEVDGRPVFLWSGSRPAWRDFAQGMPPGLDVTQLERNLAALGYGRRLTVDGRFSVATAAAVRRAGATSYLQKTAAVSAILATVRAAARGESTLPPDVATRLLNALHSEGRAVDPLDRLTPRERDVLTALAQGRSNREIARALRIGEETVKTHVSGVLAKLGLADRTQAAIYALRRGVVS